MELPSGQATATRLLLLHETGSFVVFLCNKNNGTSTYFCNYQMELPSGKTTATQLLLLQETFFLWVILFMTRDRGVVPAWQPGLKPRHFLKITKWATFSNRPEMQ